MSVPNRSALINKTFSVLKKHYTPVLPPADRPLLEHLLYACCLENAPYEAADEAFARLQQMFYDWNEIRVTTVTELAETMASLPDPSAAASRLKRCLQNVFETHYAFDIEFLNKMNLGKAEKELQKIDGATPFAVAYVVQVGLGGHAIPTSQGVIDALEVAGVISPAEAEQKRTPGLERAIPKAKGIEFASLLHQLGADFFASPFGTKVRTILTEIAPDAKQRLPKRAGKAAARKKEKAAEAPAEERPAAKASGKRRTRTTSRAKSGRAAHAKGTSSKKARAKKSGEAKQRQAAPETKGKKKKTTKTTTKKSPTKRLAQKKPR